MAIMKTDELTAKQRRFYELWQTPGTTAYGNATEAYRQSYDVANMAETTISRNAHALTLNSKIATRLKLANAAASQAVEFDKRDVMRHLVDLATADPTRVMQHRRLCCRHCFGVGHAYQWRDELEFWTRTAEVMESNTRNERAHKGNTPFEPQAMPTNEGGYGYWKTNKVNPECPQCYGEGIADVWVADTSTLTGPERRLIASIKQTRDGMEIKMRDQDGALQTIAQILRMLVNKSEVSGPDGGPIPVAAIMAVLPVDQQQAAQTYQQMMEGKTK